MRVTCICLAGSLLSAMVAVFFLPAAQTAQPDPFNFLSPTITSAEKAATATWTSTVKTIAGVAGPTLHTMSQLWNAALGPSARASLQQMSSNVSAMNPDYVRAVTEGVTAGRRSNADPQNVSPWPPAGYTGPISLWIQQDDLPTERPVEPWIVKNGYQRYDTAYVSRSVGLDGFKIRIDHAPLPNVTAEQITWFFNNIGGSSEFNGKTWPNYLLMHPRDHILAKFNFLNSEGKPGTGAFIRYDEILMSENPKGYLRSDSVTDLALASLTQAYVDLQLLVDASQNKVKYSVVIPFLNLPVFSLEWHWTPRTAPLTGLDWTTTISIIPYVLVLPQFVWEFILTAYHNINDRLPRHTVEEIANLNEIVPLIYPGKP